MGPERSKEVGGINLIYTTNIDVHAKSPFYMGLGIEGFRNCELL